MGTITGNSYTVGSVLTEVVGKNVRIFPILFNKYKTILHAFFDPMVLTDPSGNQTYTLDVKSLGGVDLAPSTVGGYKVNVLEENLFDYSTAMTSDKTVASVNEGDAVDVVVDSVSGFSAQDKVFIVMGVDGSGSSIGQELDGYISAINTGTKTLTIKVQRIDGAVPSGTALALKATQPVQRGPWLRNDNELISRSSEVYNRVETEFFIQHFSRQIAFNKDELNKEYLYEKDAKDFAMKKLSYNIGIIWQEVAKMLYKGRNLGPNNSVTGKMEMLGLEEICRITNGVHDLASSTDPVKDLFAVFTRAYESGAIPHGEQLTIMANSKFLDSLSRLGQDKIQHTTSIITELGFEIIKLKTIYGSIEVLLDPIANDLYNYSNAFLLPTSLVTLWTRGSQEMASGMKGITAADRSLKVYDVIDNYREGKKFDLELELGLIATGLTASKTPYRQIKNLVV